MRSSAVGPLVLIGVTLLLPARLAAQEATLTGTVADSTGGVLPVASWTAVTVNLRRTAAENRTMQCGFRVTF